MPEKPELRGGVIGTVGRIATQIPFVGDDLERMGVAQQDNQAIRDYVQTAEEAKRYNDLQDRVWLANPDGSVTYVKDITFNERPTAMRRLADTVGRTADRMPNILTGYAGMIPLTDGQKADIPINNLYSGTYEFTTLANDGQMNVRVRGAYECPATETDGCDLIVDGADYRVPAGEKEYTRWSRRYYVAIGLLQIPKVSEGTTIDPTGVGRWEGAEELQQLTGGILGELFGLEAGEERNTALVMWMLVCLVIAIWVYVKAWRKSGSKSGLSPIGAALATISLVFTWSILGYVFFDMKAGTAWLPLAAIIFFVIIKTWHTVKSR